MNYNLRHFFLFILFFSLLSSGYPAEGGLVDYGFIEAPSVADHFAKVEEEIETENDQLQVTERTDKGCSGSGSDKEITSQLKPKPDENTLGCPRLSSCCCYFQHSELPRLKNEAFQLLLLQPPYPRLFLLFLNIKSDLAHPAA